jgi:ribosomal protein S18 acetylase RimI-like enzyme
MTLVADGPGGVRGAIMMLFEGPVCRILSVAVAPTERRRGLGTRLMAAAEQLCRDRGYASIRLEVSTQNLPAIEFYRRLGYRTDGVLYGYYTWGEDAYSMRKEIATAANADAGRPWATSQYSS